MKQMITLKNLLLASCIAGASVANGQIHPLAFGPYTLMDGTTVTDPNWYKDYVGLRFVVNSPASVAGQKIYTHPGVGTTPWGGTVTAPIVNTQIVMPPVGGDTVAASTLTPGSMTGKIGFVYRGGGVEFVCKAARCEAAGAIAIVIVNNINGGPIGMGAGSVCPATSVTKPVFMISKEDGDAIAALYRAGDTARFTITPWGLGLANDLGFVPSAVAGWHNYAIPFNQMSGAGTPAAYKMVDGSFIANYGSADQTGVNVISELKFTPTGGSATTQHTHTVTMTTPFTGTAAATPDSIFAMFTAAGGTEYDLTVPGKGRFDLNYTIGMTGTDDYPADNSLTSSFYVTDSLFSKSRYDFTLNQPVKTIGFSFNAGGDFIWGPMYYVKNGGTSISRVQYSLSTNTPGPLGTAVNIYLYKWTDGTGGDPDGVIQNGELTLKSLGLHNFDGVLDTSGAALNFAAMGDPTSGNPTTILLEADSWYYLAIGVPGGHFLGSDGIMHPLPRIYGRALGTAGILDNSNMVETSNDNIVATPTGSHAPIPGTMTNYVGTVDSFNFNNTRGMIPSVAMITNSNPPPIDYVAPVTKLDTRVSLFPNPAKDNIQVSLSLDKKSKNVTYTIVDGLARFVSKEVHTNVKEETFTVNTSKLAPGSYYLIINTDEKAVARNFVIAK
jgi:hypothetical protein